MAHPKETNDAQPGEQTTYSQSPNGWPLSNQHNHHRLASLITDHLEMVIIIDEGLVCLTNVDACIGKQPRRPCLDSLRQPGSSWGRQASRVIAPCWRRANSNQDKAHNI